MLLEIAHALRGSYIALCMMQLHATSINLRLIAQDSHICRTMQRVHTACCMLDDHVRVGLYEQPSSQYLNQLR